MKANRRSFLQTSTLAGASLLFARTMTAAPATEGELPADIWAAFHDRRSVRRFRPDAVPEADLRRILDAARSAPTSGNQQPWKFLVVRDPAKIAALKAACLERVRARLNADQNRSEDQKKRQENRMQKVYDGYLSAPVYVVVLTDNQSAYPGYNHWDGPLAAGYLMLAARALGYGTVFLTDSIGDDITKTVLNIPDRYTRVCITPIGIPVEWPASPPKKPLDDFIANETL